MKAFLDEFKAFAVKGNVVDLAVAVVIGAAFGKIVSALVDNIVMPIVGILIGGIDFSGLEYTTGESVIAYGMFLQAIVNFVIIALAVFMAVKAINKAQAMTETTKPVEEGKPAEPTEEVKLLREIRDNLRRPL